MELQHVQIFDPITSERILPGKLGREDSSSLEMNNKYNNEWNMDISNSNSTRVSDFERRDSDLSYTEKPKIQEEDTLTDDQRKLLSPSAEQVGDHAERSLTITNTFTGKTFSIWCNNDEDKDNWLRD
mgnify:CR=1 FL=1